MSKLRFAYLARLFDYVQDKRMQQRLSLLCLLRDKRNAALFFHAGFIVVIAVPLSSTLKAADRDPDASHVPTQVSANKNAITTIIIHPCCLQVFFLSTQTGFVMYFGLELWRRWECFSVQLLSLIVIAAAVVARSEKSSDNICIPFK